MSAQTMIEDRQTIWLTATSSGLRAAFGVVWAVDAFLAWQPAFAAHYVGYLQNAAQGQPAWLQSWFQFWINLVTPSAGIFISATRIIETLIALGLLLGLAIQWTYLLGAFFSLLIWATAEGFSGPYVTEAGNLGPALVYVLIFLGLIIMDMLLGLSPYSLDHYLGEMSPGWRRLNAWERVHSPVRTLHALSWKQQGGAIAVILLALILILGSLQSAMGAAPATPQNAAAAVAPLSLVKIGPVAQARDAILPPLLGEGDSVDLTIDSTDLAVEIANGVTYQAWTFGGSVPGPVLHVRQGQTVHVRYTNKGMMQHSLDFHAAEVPPDIAYKNVDPGQTLDYSFVANTPGVFLYHCGTAPVLLHIGNGMYGAIIVDPAQPLSPADVSYVIVQSEWYASQVEGQVMRGNYQKMQAVQPDEVVFNGVAYQYRDRPLVAHVGKTIRLYVVDAGPNLSSAFHVIGSMFQAVYPDGDAAHTLTGVSTFPIAPGEGVVFDLIIPQPGKYPFVDHSMRSVSIGAVGVLDVRP
ncbi:MAG: multicopper oxidase domain-containing protein [Anaerolineaceae bacterium]|nr:multicopper oxidase domain-containing protein [Anaerolineaceae bacterium]